MLPFARHPYLTVSFQIPISLSVATRGAWGCVPRLGLLSLFTTILSQRCPITDSLMLRFSAKKPSFEEKTRFLFPDISGFSTCFALSFYMNQQILQDILHSESCCVCGVLLWSILELLGHCNSAQLETAPTKYGARKCLFIFIIHHNFILMDRQPRFSLYYWSLQTVCCFGDASSQTSYGFQAGCQSI